MTPAPVASATPAVAATEPTSQRLLDALTLRAVEPEVFDQAFEAVTQPVPWPKAYGGDMVAQSALAAMRSVDSDRELHSMHGYFMRPADIGAPVRYEVELLRDGRGYSTRQVRGYQGGKAIYAALASFHVPEAGHEWASELPAGVPEPESLPSSAETLAGVDSAAARYWSSERSFDMRHVEGPVYLTVEGERTPHQAVWVKAYEHLPDDPILHRAALAYVCDYTILESLLRVQGIAWTDPGLVTASLDHSMWFHRAGRADDWVLYAQEAVSVQRSRGLALGRFYDRHGSLLATVAQEGMVRSPR
ncbi:acyl-CoA thioesterase II [Klugiella xanthotipulae]|uniref:Acyl-CoA thioesterase-2 n=1 Tax=Klugiella xanthotipulae TaxID=244735 RepID=A0A543I710_9MICO|nr:acyl-CoA thioesterase II [Klugiella xanthotipulae]TQM66392.1 acyl-CoA thioesterase-2 [Klugiella xanthotipulae]